MNVQEMKKLVVNYAAKTGLAKPIERPKSGIQSKNKTEDGGKKAQRLLITWLTEQPKLYTKIKKYITLKDFTDPLYAKVAEKLFEDLEKDNLNPAALISLFTDEEEQKEAASLFHTKLHALESKAEEEKAFHDIVLNVKKNSYDFYMSQMGSDMEALTIALEGKKALQELEKIHFSIE